MTDVLIRGAGVASSCCAQLLRQPDIRLKIEAVDRPTQPAIMLSETTQKLLQDVFGSDGLFAGFPRISSRIVAWSQDAEPRVLPHSAVVVSERALLDRIIDLIRPQSPVEPFSGAAADWVIIAARSLPVSSQEHQFGSRIATASPVRLQSGADHEISRSEWRARCEHIEWRGIADFAAGRLECGNTYELYHWRGRADSRRILERRDA